MNTLRQTIVEIVQRKPGINGVNLVLDTMTAVNPVRFAEGTYQDTLQSLLDTGEIVEIEYVIPDMSYRVKSLYFPKGTTFPNLDHLR